MEGGSARRDRNWILLDDREKMGPYLPPTKKSTQRGAGNHQTIVTMVQCVVNGGWYDKHGEYDQILFSNEMALEEAEEKVRE